MANDQFVESKLTPNLQSSRGSNRGGRKQRGKEALESLPFWDMSSPWSRETPGDATLTGGRSQRARPCAQAQPHWPQALGCGHSRANDPRRCLAEWGGSALGSHSSSAQRAEILLRKTFTLSLFLVHLLLPDFLLGKSLP